MSKLLIFILLITSFTLFPTEDEGAPSSPITTLSKKDRIELCDDLQDLIFSFLRLIDIRLMAGVSRSYRSYVIDWKTDENRTDRPEVDKLPFLSWSRIKLPPNHIYDQVGSGQTVIADHNSSRKPLRFLIDKLKLICSKGILSNSPEIGTDLQILNADGSKTRLELEHCRDLPKFLSPEGKYAVVISLYETPDNVKQTLIFKKGKLFGLLPGYFGAFSPDEKVAVTWTEVPRSSWIRGQPPFKLNFYNLEICNGKSVLDIDVGILYYNNPASFGYSKNGKLAVLFENGHISVVNTQDRIVQNIYTITPLNHRFKVDEQDFLFTTRGERFEYIDSLYPNSAISFTPDDEKIVIARPVRFDVIPPKYREFKENPALPDNQTQFTLIYTIELETRDSYGKRYLIPGSVKSAKYSKDGCFLDILDKDGFLRSVYPMSLEFHSVEPIKAPESFFQRNRIKIALATLIVGATMGLLFARKRIKTALIKGKRKHKKLELAKKLAIEKKKVASESDGGKAL